MYQGVPPTVDPRFVKDLREFDSKLSIEFNRQISRFVITREAMGKKFNIWVVESDTGGFRQPDHREITALSLGDLWRGGGVRERIAKGEKYMADYREKEERDSVDEIRNRTKDDKLQLRRTFRQACNDGKANSEFERINIKNKGLTVGEIRQARAEGRDPWSDIHKVA